MGFFNRQRWGRTLLLSAVTVWIAAGSAVGQAGCVDITAKFKDSTLKDRTFRWSVYNKIGKTSPAPILDCDVMGIDTFVFNHGGGVAGETDLSGIEYFASLTYLDCQGSEVTMLDLSKNTKLTYLNCSYNQLTTLDVSKNTALVYLDCRRMISGKLTTLDLSKNTKLTYVDCSENKLTALDVSKNTALTDLNCEINQLTILDVSKNTALTKLRCGWNKLTTLDVSKNTALTDLVCGSNQLTTLDVSKNTALTMLHCYENRLTTLDVSKNTTLTMLDCDWNRLTALDVNTALTNLECGSNKLTTLDVSKNTALTNLRCDANQLTTLDVSKNTALTDLVCGSNQLTTLDVSKNTALTSLSCYSNQLTTLDVSKNTALTNLRCDANQLTTLDVSKNTALTSLSCYANQLTTLDVSKNTALTNLNCGNNQLTTLDVSKNTDLGQLKVQYNCFISEDNIIGLDKSAINFTFNPQKTVVVTFDSQGGSAISSQTASNYKVVKPTDPTRSGYIFGGWYREGACIGTAWNFNIDIVTADIKLYAKWIPIFTVTFNATGGTVTPTSGKTGEDSTLVSSLPTSERSNYIFNGWFTTQIGGEKVTPSKKYSANTTIYAQWIPIFTVTFNATSGTVTPTSGTTRIDSTLASLPTPTKDDYAFNGWFTAETGGEKITESKKYSANTTIYAQWTQFAYTVTLDPTSGTVTPRIIRIGENGRVVSLPIPTRTDYTFDSWFTATTGGEKVTEGYIINKDTTFYARWTYNSVTEITGVPNKIKINEQFPLTATVVPENAARNTIVWSIENAGTTGAGVYDGIFIAMSEGTVVLKATIADGRAVGTPYEQRFFINAVVSVASPDRIIPAHRPNNELTSIALPTVSPVIFTVGPNPASKSSSVVTFYRNGAKIKGATLHIYDASGNKVATVKSGEWNLRDASGRLVSPGTYLARGEVGDKSGKRERVSVVVGVR